MKYIIIDWANNHCFKNKSFETFEDGWSFLYCYYDDESYYQEYEVIKENEYKGN
jgi:hypothetical protein